MSLRECLKGCKWKSSQRIKQAHFNVLLDVSLLGHATFMLVEQVAYPDVGPVMLLSEASVDDLSSRLAKDVTVERFRPNIIVGDCGPFEEVFTTHCSHKTEYTAHSYRDERFFHWEGCFSPPVWVQ